MSNNNIMDLLPSSEASTPNEITFENGDGVVILKKDGSYQTVTIGMNPADIIARAQAGDQSDEVMQAIAVGEKIFAVLVALGNEGIMNMLCEIAADPSIIDRKALMSRLRPH